MGKWVRNKQALQTIIDLGGLQRGDQVRIKLRSEDDNPLEATTHTGVWYVHSIDRDPSYPVNLVRKSESASLDWEECAHPEQIWAWRRPSNRNG